jgi:hypothetical protein
VKRATQRQAGNVIEVAGTASSCPQPLSNAGPAQAEADQ